MKLLNTKRIGTKVDGRIRRARESRFGMVVSIDEANRLAVVRIQGSDRDIYMPWSKNFYGIPPYVRINNPVEIQHIKGNPNTFEIIGNGTQIPTPQEGSLLAPLPATRNVVIDGAKAKTSNVDGMTLRIDHGSVRIDNEHYNLPGILLGNPAMGLMGENPEELMALSGSLITVAPAPAAPNYRVDLISMGEDRVIDYTTGVPSPDNPQVPALENNHVLITTIIVPYETTEMKQSYIGLSWAAPYLATFIVEMAESTTNWATVPQPNPDNLPLPNEERRTTGTISLLDQYGKPMYGSFRVTITIDSGNGSLQPGTPNVTSKDVVITNGANNTFVYERGGVDGIVVLGDPTDQSPMFKAALTADSGKFTYTHLELLDSAGDVMVDLTGT